MLNWRSHTAEAEIEKAAYLAGISPEISQRLVKDIVKSHNKKKLYLSPCIKSLICKCYLIQIPTVTCHSRIKREKDGMYLETLCLFCEHKRTKRVLCKRKDFTNGGRPAEAKETEQTRKERT
ncbi:hypothetical protein NEFER03_0861 [Nematocida sp. LUAm3]|nr:hypothetical protein NEFER03_0861 [Nematocida sp. LUAm3]KAI5174879.1 hypothetical protein NEFER02_0979 [Nematocida sp. LUAm2]KAI5177523.1 hypothetical protein NEFER01_0773 [Nematocida sp. LUAm1]